MHALCHHICVTVPLPQSSFKGHDLLVLAGGAGQWLSLCHHQQGTMQWPQQGCHLHPCLERGHKTWTLQPSFGGKTKESSDQGFAICAGAGLLGGQKGCSAQNTFLTLAPLAAHQLIAGFSFPKFSQIAGKFPGPNKTATHGACHWLQRSLPRGSVAMATVKKKKKNSDPARRLSRWKCLIKDEKASGKFRYTQSRDAVGSRQLLGVIRGTAHPAGCCCLLFLSFGWKHGGVRCSLRMAEAWRSSVQQRWSHSWLWEAEAG